MVAEKIGYSEIDLSLIERGCSQARQSKTHVDLENIVESIRTQGLIDPIHLVEIEKDKLYELISGQRRFLAFTILCKKDPEKFSKIPCVLYKNTMNEWEKKTFSIHTNLSQAPMNKMDKINSITLLFDHFESIKDTSEATGFSHATIRKYVQVSRLPEQLKNMTEKGEISLDTALDTADLYAFDPNKTTGISIEDMLDSAREMQKLTGKHKKYIMEVKQQKPDVSVRDIITDVSSKKYKKYDFTVAVDLGTYEKIDAYKENRRIDTITMAVADLIEDGLVVNEVS